MQIFPDFSGFSKNYSDDKPQLVAMTLSADLETPVSAALKLKDESFCCLFESVEQGRNRGRYSFIAISPDLIWQCKEGKAEINYNAATDLNIFEEDKLPVLESLRAVIKKSRLDIPKGMPSMSAGLFGYMGYDMVRYMEKIPDNNPDVTGIPESIFIRPQIVIIFDSVKDSMTIVTPIFSYKHSAERDYDIATERVLNVAEKLAKTNIEKYYIKNVNNRKVECRQNVTSNTTREEYIALVKNAKDYIYAGDIFQVVPSQRFTVDFPYDCFSLYRSLRSLNPSPYSFYMNMNGFSLVGSSPEILVRVEDGNVTVRPIAGTRKRGKDSAEDMLLAADLLSDEKELAEHLMLIDLGRNDVGRVSKTGTVKVTEKMVIEYYSHVMHIVSNVEGKIRDDVDALDAVIAGFPVGTVSGAPKIRAMEIIDELETERRSFYAGGIGYFSANGGVDTCIALRTGLVKDKKLYIQAGGGVVADSDPEAEYQETCNKAQALLQAAKIVAEREGA
ncbi:MAG: trpE [Rickettsiaceae bacterium]|jgi:anthranilate synthase component 1|nr:trpE [Rickettsiaceae bacterium]